MKQIINNINALKANKIFTKTSKSYGLDQLPLITVFKHRNVITIHNWYNIDSVLINSNY